MKKLEKDIIDAARDNTRKFDAGFQFVSYSDSFKRGFIAGAMSPEAKAFHTQGIYTEEEVRELCEKAYTFSVHDYSPHKNTMKSFSQWFEQNKKKP